MNDLSIDVSTLLYLPYFGHLHGHLHSHLRLRLGDFLGDFLGRPRRLGVFGDGLGEYSSFGDSCNGVESMMIFGLTIARLGRTA